MLAGDFLRPQTRVYWCGRGIIQRLIRTNDERMSYSDPHALYVVNYHAHVTPLRRHVNKM